MKAAVSDFRVPDPSEVKRGTIVYRMHFKCWSDKVKGICQVTQHKIDTSFIASKEELEEHRERVKSLIRNKLLFIKK